MREYLVKIPENVITIYSKKKQIIIFMYKNKVRSLKLKNQIFFLTKSYGTIMKITSKPFFKQSNDQIKKLKILQGTVAALLKQTLVELLFKVYLKIKLVGVGYKFFNEKSLFNKIILIKLGFSHVVYYRAPKSTNFFCFKKNTIMFIYGSSYLNVTQAASSIREFKKPDCYKGKGVLYFDEIITLKEGKKVK